MNELENSMKIMFYFFAVLIFMAFISTFVLPVEYLVSWRWLLGIVTVLDFFVILILKSGDEDKNDCET